VPPVRSGGAQIIPSVTSCCGGSPAMRTISEVSAWPASLLIVPLTTRDPHTRPITFVTAESSRQYREADLLPAELPRAPGRHGGQPLPGSGAGPTEGTDPRAARHGVPRRAGRAAFMDRSLQVVRVSAALSHDGCAGRGASGPRALPGAGAGTGDDVFRGGDRTGRRCSARINQSPRGGGLPRTYLASYYPVAADGKPNRSAASSPASPSADTPQGLVRGGHWRPSPRSGGVATGQQRDDRDHRRQRIPRGTLAEETRAGPWPRSAARPSAAGIARQSWLQPAAPQPTPIDLNRFLAAAGVRAPAGPDVRLDQARRDAAGARRSLCSTRCWSVWC
jgi:hypothetical protein